jgi:DNA invertase Pin-like site-specific DNA recombinase
MHIRAYLRASTEDQDALRAKKALQTFAKEQGVKVASWHVENASGASMERPELLKLIANADEGDVLLVEQIDRLTRLKEAEWELLKDKLKNSGIKVVSIDLPTSWMALKAPTSESEANIAAGILKAINAMLLEMLALQARKDYEDRRRRQAEGIEKAKTAGLYKGRQADQERHALIAEMLDKGMSWSSVSKATGASRSTILRVVNARKETAAE